MPGARPRGRVTLAEVASRAGVSRTTASYVLNGRTAQMRISPAVEQRVRSVAESAGYRPDLAAASLRTRRSRTIGVISDHVAGGMFSSRLLVGAGRAAREQGHVLLIGESGGEPATAAAIITEMVDRRVDGVLLVTAATSQVRLPEGLGPLPVVTVNCTDPDASSTSVLPDERAGGRAAAQVLLEAGHRGIVVAGEDAAPEVLAGRLRLAGIAEALSAAGLPPAERIACGWTVEGAYAGLAPWLHGGARPRALVCLTDRVAMGAYQALAELGLRVPEDVSVVSFDGSEIAQWLRPSVTSVAIPFDEMGARGVRALLDGEQAQVLLPMPVVDGGSVAAPGVRQEHH
ncbi:LacI family DNA-binding transcriptional regulator [Nocardioides nanhaiensis]|uniref:LacI family DNA-binding transcriptional regulator n=1 Tax=Nocardioides nanhaiensis TaxID=1476871 RepID=A0ABP8W595_9ACTN